MKKILLVIIILSFASSISFADDRTGKPYNYGYAKRHGMVAITGNLTDRISNAWGELAPGGGGFVYYNILNDFWGNFSIGLSADYIGGDFTTKNQNIKGKAAYRFNGALLYIKNPYGYGVRPNPEEVNNPYFFNFWGIVKKDRIDNVSYLFIGPNERQQFMSGNCTFYLIKDK